ncbi:MAG: NUDIX hydrolase, partial [Candidatus Eremiobacteraeota bacterium]|nr:NUDIX hydrolase [Candidatus Eremiobacteraeota bacterium]
MGSLGVGRKGRERHFVADVVKTRRIYEGRVLNVRVDDVTLPNGRTAAFEIVEHNGGVCIVAQPTPDTIVLVRQYRPATGRTLLEVPAGKLESGEDPLKCARRELLEETGYRCSRLRRLWSFYTAPGFCSELLHLFVAEGLTAGQAQPEQNESIDVEIMDVEKAWAMVERDEIPDAKTQIALSWARC